MTEYLLEARGVVAGYAAADMILKGVDLAVAPHEVVAIIGPNGAGKSTLLKAIAGILTPSAGTITLAGAPIQGRPAREICASGLAFVPQEANVFPTMSVRENLEMGGFVQPRETRQRIEEIFVRFPILAEKRRQAARTLSGGQRQILAMAMALMVAPKLLLLDEPSAGLSPIAAEKLFDTIRGIHAEGTAIAMVEQNALEALAIAHRGVILVDGRNAREGAAAELATDPDVRRIFLGG
ncbi:ABC transporter ATP-binding protein [Elioraea sp.]|uniref:ABC transporter ATP-binding protein n=1 Tax=Elioraea sp. TaxID=2185103 RepID=UPI0025BFAB87|nr:ABC transporter ATP-binding protein [Elioraea sp.]